MIKMKIRYLVVTLVTIHFSLLMPHLAWAQPKVMQLIKQMPSYASCNYHVYPDSITTPLTPSPAGKKPLTMVVMARVISAAAAATISHIS